MYSQVDIFDKKWENVGSLLNFWKKGKKNRVAKGKKGAKIYPE